LCDLLTIADTAGVYRNEADIGACLGKLMAKHGLERKDVFITSKLSTLVLISERDLMVA
jgi:diketogulonate reductase-like aldo/keto reductase